MKRTVTYLGIPVAVYVVYILLANIGLFFIGTENGVVLTTLIDLCMSVVCISMMRKCLSDKSFGYVKRPVSGCKPVLWLVLLIAVYFTGQCVASVIYNNLGDTAFDTYASELGSVSTVLYVILTVVIAPMYEELFFRGVVYRSVKQIIPRLGAGVVSAGLFALSHGTIIHMVPTFLLGFLSCIVYEYTDRVGFSVLLHAAYNLITVVFGGAALPDMFFKSVFLVLAIGFLMGVMVIMFLSKDFQTCRADTVASAVCHSPVCGDAVCVKDRDECNQDL